MSADRDHSLIEELLSADALGGLDPADRALLDRERAAHGACEECARLEAEFTEVAGHLGLVLDLVPVRAGMAEDILRAADAAGFAPRWWPTPHPRGFRPRPWSSRSVAGVRVVCGAAWSRWPRRWPCSSAGGRSAA